MSPDDIARLFTQPDGTYRFARWVRPIVPVVFGVEDATLAVIKGALEAVVTLAGHKMAETDPEQGVNVMVFFLRNWGELAGVPDLDGLVAGMSARLPRLEREGVRHYQHMRLEADGAIRASFIFVRMDETLAETAADELALGVALQAILAWASGALAAALPLTATSEGASLSPVFARLLRAAYDPLLPSATTDPAHALRLFARASLNH